MSITNEMALSISRNAQLRILYARIDTLAKANTALRESQSSLLASSTSRSSQYDSISKYGYDSGFVTARSEASDSLNQFRLRMKMYTLRVDSLGKGLLLRRIASGIDSIECRRSVDSLKYVLRMAGDSVLIVKYAKLYSQGPPQR